MVYLILLFVSMLSMGLCQVNTNKEELYNAFYTSSLGLSTINETWLNVSHKDEYERFLICVDVYQKKNKITFWDKPFFYNSIFHQLPHFQYTIVHIQKQSASINFAKVFKLALYCPLDKIQFGTPPHLLTGHEFYVSESVNNHCVYYLASLPSFIKDIEAEICNLFSEVRDNENEVATEVVLKSGEQNINAMLVWNELIHQSPEEKYQICLEVYEKLNGVYLYGQRSAISLNFPISQCSMAGAPINILLCPMNFLSLTNPASTANNEHAQYYLSKSINKGCVYKMEPSNIRDIDLNEAPKISKLHIKAEICGVLETVNSNVSQLQNDFFSLWNPSGTAFRVKWPSIFRMSRINKYRLCSNVARKVYRKTMKFRSIETYLYMPTKEKLYLAPEFNNLIKITSLACPIHRPRNPNHLNFFYIADSVNLGCIYKMRPVLTATGPYALNHVLIIEQEVCRVFPFQHLLANN